MAYWAAHGGHTAILQLLLTLKAMPLSQPETTAKVSNTKGEAIANYLAAALIGEAFIFLQWMRCDHNIIENWRLHSDNV